jgi:ATP-dependent Clp protease ATP-binding subunit ClpA
VNPWDSVDNFTDRAREAFKLAQEEALLAGRTCVGPEHLFLGLIREGAGIAASVLRRLDIELDRVRSLAESIDGPVEGTVFGELPLTFHAQKAIELAVDEAHHFHHSYVGPEHLLLGLIHKDDAAISSLLERLGIPPKEVRWRIIAIFNNSHWQERDETLAHSSEADPWLTVAQRYAPEQTVTGTITRIAPFGAFVHIEDGVEGLLHISAVPPGTDLKLHEGQQLQLCISRIDAERHRLGLMFP